MTYLNASKICLVRTKTPRLASPDFATQWPPNRASQPPLRRIEGSRFGVHREGSEQPPLRHRAEG